MRRVISSFLITLDGYIDHTVMVADEQQADEVHQYATDELNAADVVLFGRVTYQLFARDWPAAEADPTLPSAVLAYARKINSVPKIVFSNTLEKAGWNNARLIKGDAAAELSKLKQQPGGDLVIAASGALVRSLMPHDLIDEYRLLFNPLVVGDGTRLFREGNHMNLRLIGTRQFNSGIVELVYHPASKGR